MASIPRADLSKSEHDELCCVYSALLLHDQGVDLSAGNLEKIITASGNRVESYWPSLFSKSLKGVDFGGLLSSVGSGSASAAPATAATTQGKTEDKKAEEPKKAEEEEDVLAGGIGFGDDDEW